MADPKGFMTTPRVTPVRRPVSVRISDWREVYTEFGTAQLALGRSLIHQDRLDEAQDILRAADRSYEQLASVSHRAAVWIALGDLAQRRGHDREAARLYRKAAEALQDVRF